jgi:hypothetical protein
MMHLCCAALLVLVQGKKCDDNWAVNVASTIKTASLINCKTDEVIEIVGAISGGGDRGSMTGAWCPQLVVYTPAHGAPDDKPHPGWDLTGPIELRETIYKYACKRDWILFFPITGLYCQYLSTEVGGVVQHFGSKRCPIRTETAPTLRF